MWAINAEFLFWDTRRILEDYESWYWLIIWKEWENYLDNAKPVSLSLLNANEKVHHLLNEFLKEGNEIDANECVYIENRPCQINLLLFSGKSEQPLM